MAGGGRSGPGKARIEIIPLIDIIFFLLATFVMVSLSMARFTATAPCSRASALRAKFLNHTPG